MSSFFVSWYQYVGMPTRSGAERIRMLCLYSVVDGDIFGPNIFNL